ncbi:collagen alpha-4(IV) chain-like [Culicoides brevitarsis]|uniref:collagen alpha-4(IV) chain-like n=1 Tax=Culicoides brevitarsis TaxID=469753 RepID=UPI00307B6F7F
MRIKQGLILLLVICIVVAEVSAAKQKGGKNGKGGKNEKKVKGGKHEGGKQEKNQKNEKYNAKNEEKVEAEAPVEEEEPAMEENKENIKAEKASKKGEKMAKEGKMKNEKKAKKNKEEPAAGNCDCPPGPPGPQGPPGPPGEVIYQPICPETLNAQDSLLGSCGGAASAGGCSCGKDCPCKQGMENKYSADANAAIEPSQIFMTKAAGVIAIHSQNTIIPQCPIGQNKLWEGYSLMKLETNGQASNFDLGSSGSCVKSFMPSISATCDIEGQCKIGQRNDRSYWLLANGTIGSEPMTQEIAQNIISRCVVCDVPSAVVAVHSQSTEIPKCPAGWDDMWIGYSYLDSSLGEQNLANAGSCLKEFHNPLFIECNPSKNSCNLLESHKSSWMIAEQAPADPVEAVVKETVEKIEAVIKQETGAEPHTESAIEISRCAVCVKVAV